jgi:hypothetical protein
MRRTHETEMNAQSSRSHAIFSLTLIQKKYSGSGAPLARILPSHPQAVALPPASHDLDRCTQPRVPAVLVLHRSDVHQPPPLRVQ